MAEISRAFQMSDGKGDRNVNNSGTNLSTLQSMQQQHYNGNVPTFPTPVNQQQGNVQRARGRFCQSICLATGILLSPQAGTTEPF